MDISEEYIKMCDCGEVQGQWNKKDNEYSISYENKDIWISHEGNFTYKSDIWLPTQAQIQAILYLPNDKGLPMKLAQFAGWADVFFWHKEGSPYPNKGYRIANFCESWEQLWLAYYMWQEHLKIWDGKKWVKHNAK